MSASAPRYFKSPSEFRAWLEQHHADASELLVGYYKRATGKPSMTWPESVDEALCFGWIDGIRRSIDEERYCIRFTPRRRGSIWSVVNTKRVAELTREGRMRPAGLKVFEERDPKKTQLYSFERETAAMPPAYERRFRANAKAWTYWQAAPPGYKRSVTHWLTSAKREETRERRLAALIERCAIGRKIAPLEPTPSARARKRKTR